MVRTLRLYYTVNDLGIRSRRVTNNDKDGVLKQRLLIPTRLMSLGGLSIVSICVLVLICQMLWGVLTMSTLRQFQETNCEEASLTNQYKIVVTQRRDGNEDISITDFI